MDEQKLNNQEERLLRNVLRTSKPGALPNVDKAWDEFCSSHQNLKDNISDGTSTQDDNTLHTDGKKVKKLNPHWKSMVVGSLIGIAASVVVAMLLFYNLNVGSEQYIVYEPGNSIQHTTLVTNHGEYKLDGSDEASDIDGIVADNQSLDYTNTDESDVDSHVLMTPCGEDYKVTLPDGTVVWLNAESRLEYPTRFGSKERKVKLVGEAFFNVKHDPNHPFIIETEKFMTKVLGTEFNVCCYPTGKAHVTLVSGSLEVKMLDGSHTTKLEPGEDAELSKNGFSLCEVETDDYYFWKEGYFYFDDVPLIEVAQTLGRWYNVKVVFEDKTHLNDRVHLQCERKAGIENAIKIINGMKIVEFVMKSGELHVK